MSPEEVGDLLERAFLFYDREAARSKEPNLEVMEFIAWYGDRLGEARPVADAIVTEWAISEDSRRRFMALAVIDDYAITSALPVLRKLADRFEHSNEVSAPYDWANVNRIIGRLVEGQQGDETIAEEPPG